MKSRSPPNDSTKLPYLAMTLLKILHYLKRCLHNSSGVTSEEEASDDFLPKVSKYLSNLRHNEGDLATFENYLQILQCALSPLAGSVLHAASLNCILEIAASFPGQLLPYPAFSTSQLQGLIKSNNEEARDSSAHILGLIITTKTPKEVDTILKELLKNIDSDNPDLQHGSMLAAGYCLSSLNKTIGLDQSENNHLGLLHKVLAKLGEKISHSNAKICSSACTALGELGRDSALPIENDGCDRMDDDVSHLRCSKLDLTKKLLAAFSDAKDAKVKESAALALGFLCVGEVQFPHRQLIVKGLFESAKDRQTELNFTVGEALSCVAAGPLSLRAKDKWSIVPASEGGLSHYDDTLLKEIVLKIETDHVPSTAAYLRQAAAIWLLSLVKFIGRRDVLVVHLQRIQVSFIALLADSDEIAQEVASRGLSLVYDMVDDETKSSLVSLLVDRLMSGKRPKRRIDESTELFQAGSLGESPDGTKLSTYKEICSLATSLNRPELVYKFMNLANHNALWNSKKGAAFGFLGIAARAKEQLQPYLPQLIPQLYRYQYDPNPGVQQAMRNIWSAIAPSGKRSFDEYTNEIMKDLIKHLTNPAWRIRESSCLAVNDLIKICAAEDLIGYLPELWLTLFKVLDDIKESVRKGATAASKTLSRITCRVCDVNQSSLSEKALDKALPALLDTGISSRVADVRAISLDTMVKISKNAGKHLKYHIPKLMVPLLESLSGLEPQALNTLSLQLDNTKETRDKLDLLRISASKSSPMMEAINICVVQVDSDVLEGLVPRLADLLRRGIGLGTKAGCCSLVSSLALQCRHDLTPFAGRLLSALLGGLGDHNAAIRKAYANAIGQLVLYSKESSVMKLLAKLKSWYLEKNDETRLRESCCWTIQAMTRHSPDVTKTHASVVIPLVFVAIHEETVSDGEGPNLKAIWDDIWNNVTPGTQSGIKLYLGEIMETVRPVLFSSSWALKAQGARAMATVARSLGASLSHQHLVEIVRLLSESLPGRTWKGKEQIVVALAMVFVKCKASIERIEEDQSDITAVSVNKVIDDLLRECSKSDPTYKRTSITSLSSILEAYEADRYPAVWRLVSSIFETEDHLTAKKSKDDEDDDARDLITDDTLLACLEAIGACWPKEAATQAEFGESVTDLLLANIEKRTWKLKLSVFKSIEKFNTRFLWSNAEAHPSDSFVSSYVGKATKKVSACLGNAPQAILQVRCLECLKSLLSPLEGTGIILSSVVDFDDLHSTVKIKSMSPSPEVARSATDLLRFIDDANAKDITD